MSQFSKSKSKHIFVFTSSCLLLFLLSAASVVANRTTFSDIQFCDETYFDNVFQDYHHIYLNVYDANRAENRLYRWTPTAERINEIEQFVTANVDNEFRIPQSGFHAYLPIQGKAEREHVTVRTYYTLSDETFAIVCTTYGDGGQLREKYSCANPYPFYPLCGCTAWHPEDAYVRCERPQAANRRYDQLRTNHPVFPYFTAEDGSFNNKYRSYYFHVDRRRRRNRHRNLHRHYQQKNENFSSPQESNRSLFAFKRFAERAMVVMPPDFDSSRALYRMFPINFEVIGMFDLNVGGVDHPISPLIYLLEEVIIPTLSYRVQYIWRVDIDNIPLRLHHRQHWRQFFGCTARSDRISWTIFILVPIFAIVVVMSIVFSLIYFYFDYDLLLLKAKQTHLSYYLS